MKKMLINATQQEELRVALVDGQQLYDLDIETLHSAQKKSNIYKGKITRIEPSLEAVFVDYGAQKHGFLPFKEIAKEYLTGSSQNEEHQSIKDMLRIGQQVLVQIDKEERGNKGAALTTYISLAGRFLVLMPNNPRAGGVSRRIQGDERQELRDVLEQLTLPEEMGIIIRTAGMGRGVDELQWDLDFLLQVWQAISDEYQRSEPQRLIYQDNNIVVRALRDYLRADIHKILIDDERVYQQAKSFMELVMPNNLNKLERYQNNVPLFSRYQIEGQIESAYQRNVQLPSGGELVIDYTEALTSIDINSSKATKGGDIEETAYQTNLEAADEIARQMRLRDLGGLIVIDFIDMNSSRNRKEIEHRLLQATQIDRARVQIGRISRFGLLELSRQRLRPSMDELSHHVCPRCRGQGSIRSVQSMALSLLRIIEEEALKEKTVRIMGELPVQVATYLLNEKRATLRQIEQRNKVDVILIPNPNMHTPNYQITRLREDDLGEQQEWQPSYRLPLNVISDEEEQQERQPQVVTEQAAVQSVLPSKPAPETERPDEQAAAKSALAETFAKVVDFFKQDRRDMAAWMATQTPATEAVPAKKSNELHERPARRKHNKHEMMSKLEKHNEKAEKTSEKVIEKQENNAAAVEKQEKRRPEKHERPEKVEKAQEALAGTTLPKELQAAAARDEVNPKLEQLNHPPAEINGRSVRKGRPRDVHAVRGQGKADYVAPTSSTPQEALPQQPDRDKNQEKNDKTTLKAPALVHYLQDNEWPQETNKGKKQRPRREKNQQRDAESQWQQIIGRVEASIAAVTAAAKTETAAAEVPQEALPVSALPALPAKIQALRDLGQQFYFEPLQDAVFLDEKLQNILKSAHGARNHLGQLLQDANVRNSHSVLDLVREQAARAWQIQPELILSLDLPFVFAAESEALIQQMVQIQEQLRDSRIRYRLPASDAGIAALEALTARGISTQLNCVFGTKRLLQAQQAYWRGLEALQQQGQALQQVHSLIGFGLNLIDEEMDSHLKAEHQDVYKGRVAISLAKSSYATMMKTQQESASWQALAAAGAQAQTLLWLGTETLNPAYAKVRYIDHLIGAQTATTMNAQTYQAFLAQGKAEATLEQDLERAQAMMTQLDTEYDFNLLAQRLEAYSERVRYRFCQQWQDLSHNQA